jgi:hypothetical protein
MKFTQACYGQLGLGRIRKCAPTAAAIAVKDKAIVIVPRILDVSALRVFMRILTQVGISIFSRLDDQRAANSSLNLIDACVPSQKGLFLDWPHRQSVTRLRTSY